MNVRSILLLVAVSTSTLGICACHTVAEQKETPLSAYVAAGLNKGAGKFHTPKYSIEQLEFIRRVEQMTWQRRSHLKSSEEILQLFLPLVQDEIRILGPDDLHLSRTLLLIAKCQLQINQGAGAEKTARHNLRIRDKWLGVNSCDSAIAVVQVVSALRAQKQFKKAVELTESRWQQAVSDPAANPNACCAYLYLRGINALDEKDYGKARDLFEKSLAIKAANPALERVDPRGSEVRTVLALSIAKGG